MAIAKSGYVTAYSGVATEKITLNQNGTIAMAGQVVAGAKKVTMKNLNADNDLTDNHTVIKAFYDLLLGSTLVGTNKFTVSWEAV